MHQCDTDKKQNKKKREKGLGSVDRIVSVTRFNICLYVSYVLWNYVNNIAKYYCS